MISKACYTFSLLLLFIILSHCSERPKVPQTANVSVDSTTLINQLLEKDRQKIIDTANVVYDLGNGESYIKGELIKRIIVDTSIVNKNITLKAETKDVKSLIPIIQLQIDMRIIVMHGAFERAKKVNFNVVNKPLIKFLAENICKGQPFDYRIIGSSIIFSPIKEDTVRIKANDSMNCVIKVPNESLLHLKLSDKTNAWLNAGSVISISRNPQRDRNIRLAGEGYFELKNGCRDSIIIKTPGGHTYILKRGTLNVNTFDGISDAPNEDYLPPTDQELKRLNAEGAIFDINCNPCKLDSLFTKWNTAYTTVSYKEGINQDTQIRIYRKPYRIVYSQETLEISAVPVFIEMAHARFKDVALGILSKQPKLGGYFTEAGELIIMAKENNYYPIDSLKYFASINGEGQLYNGDDHGKIELDGKKGILFGFFGVRQWEKCDPTAASSWTKGFFSGNPTLGSKPLIESIGRWYNVEIIFSKKINPLYSFEGKIPMQSSLKTILELLKLNNVQYELKLPTKGEKLNLIIK